MLFVFKELESDSNILDDYPKSRPHKGLLDIMGPAPGDALSDSIEIVEIKGFFGFDDTSFRQENR